MFTVTDEYVFTHPVKVSVPTDGGHERQEFKATFRVMPAVEQDSYDLGTTEGSTGFLRGILVKLDDLVDGDKRQVPYSDALRDRLLAFSFIRLALSSTYFAAVNKAAEGN